MIQLVMRGVISYAALVGIPAPVSLHAEDDALSRLILRALGTRVTAERVSVYVKRSGGGT